MRSTVNTWVVSQDPGKRARQETTNRLLTSLHMIWIWEMPPTPEMRTNGRPTGGIDYGSMTGGDTGAAGGQTLVGWKRGSQGSGRWDRIQMWMQTNKQRNWALSKSNRGLMNWERKTVYDIPSKNAEPESNYGETLDKPKLRSILQNNWPVSLKKQTSQS